MKKDHCQCLITIMVCIFGQTRAGDPQPIMFPGQVNIALLTDLHGRIRNNNTQCEVPKGRSLDLATSAVWAVNQANLHREPQEARIGIISQSEKRTTNAIAKILEAFSIPLVLTSDDWSSNFNSGGNVFSTAPSLTSLARAVVQTLVFLQVKKVALVQLKDLTNPSRVFQLEADRHGIQVSIVIHLPSEEVTQSSIISLKRTLPQHVQAMVFFVNGSYVEEIARSNVISSVNVVWIFATTTEFNFERCTPDVNLLSKLYVILPKLRKIPEFHLTHEGPEYIATDVPSEKSSYIDNINYYLTRGDTSSTRKKLINGKTWHPSHHVKVSIENTNEEKMWTEQSTHDADEKMATANAVWILSEAARFVQKSAYWNPGRCLHPEPRTLASDVLNHLPKLNVTFDGQSLMFGKDRRLASMKFVVMKASNVPKNWTEVATYSDSESFVQTPQTTRSLPEEQSPNESVRKSFSTLPTKDAKDPVRTLPTTATPDMSMNFTNGVKLSTWVRRPWAITVLSLSTLGILLCIYAFVYHLLKMCDGTLKPESHFLSCLHLLTLIGMYSAAAVVTLKHTLLICILKRITQNISFVACFGCFVLKATHLHTKPSFLGLGSRISHLSQLLMLLFIVGIQVVLDVHWVMGRPECSTSTSEFFISQIYITILLTVAFMATICTLRSAASGFEAHCLLAATFTCGVVLGARAAVYYAIQDIQSRDISLSFSLVITATVTYVAIAAPLAYSLQTNDSEFHGSEEDSLSSRARFPRAGGGSSRRSSRVRNQSEAYFNDGFSVPRASIFAAPLPVYIAESAQL